MKGKGIIFTNIDHVICSRKKKTTIENSTNAYSSGIFVIMFISL